MDEYYGSVAVMRLICKMDIFWDKNSMLQHYASRSQYTAPSNVAYVGCIMSMPIIIAGGSVHSFESTDNEN
ncbi:hypothetical protein LTR15_012030 [Elasticomyces elasticus]|nr:hypothetical protein LTR15_012030 [Elasticomyces elasticus]